MSDPSPSRRASASAFGATTVHDPGAGAPEGLFDVVFECAGMPGLVQTAIDAATVHGRVVVAGVCLGPDQISHIPAVMKEVQVSYAVYYRTDEFASAARLLNGGTLDPTSFVSRTVPLDAVAQAFDDLQSGSDDRKVLIDPGV